MKSDYLTQEDLLHHLEHNGLEVSERTLRFWVAKGILEPPLRKPYKHADGRKKYFPIRVVGEITEIFKLQEEGWKLTQIKHRLRDPAKANQSEQPNPEQLARLFLEDYLNNGEFRDRLKVVEGSDPSTPQWRKIRNFLVVRLAHFVGRKQAVRSVTSFMVGLSQREVKKLLRRSTQRPGKAADENSAQRPGSATLNNEKLKSALHGLNAPVWEEQYPEPVLSLRIRECLAKLRALSESEEPDSWALQIAWQDLAAIRGELGSSLRLLKTKPKTDTV